MCRIRKLFIALLLCCACSFVCAQDAQVNLEQELAVTSSSISANLVNLKVQSETMKELLMTIDGTIELFGQYQQLVEQLIRNYNMLRSEVKDTVSYTGRIIDSNSDTYYIYDSRVHPVHTRYKSAEMAGHLAIVQEKENEHRE